MMSICSTKPELFSREMLHAYTFLPFSQDARHIKISQEMEGKPIFVVNSFETISCFNKELTHYCPLLGSFVSG